MYLGVLNGSPFAGAAFRPTIPAISTFGPYDPASAILGESASEYIAPAGVCSFAMANGGGGRGIGDLPSVRFRASGTLVQLPCEERLSPKERWPDRWQRLLDLGPGPDMDHLLASELGIHHPILDAFMESAWDEMRWVNQPKLERRVAMLRLCDYEADVYPTGRHLFDDIDGFQTPTEFIRYKSLASPMMMDAMLVRFGEMMGDEGIDRHVRRLVVDMTKLIVDSLSADALVERLPHIFKRILMPALRSGDPYAFHNAFELLMRCSPAVARRLGVDELGDLPPMAPMRSTEFGMEKYVRYSSGIGGAARASYVMHAVQDIIGDLNDGEMRECSIAFMKPIQSLADYHPDPAVRRPVMRDKYRLLQGIAAEVKADRREFFRRYFGGEGKAYGVGRQWPSVLDENYLLEGHHRVAALIEAAAAGVIPMGWLNEVPFRVYSHPWTTSDIVTRIFLTGGVDLEWADFFPAGHYRDTVNDLLMRVTNANIRRWGKGIRSRREDGGIISRGIRRG